MFAVTLNQLRASSAFGDLHNTYSHLHRLLGKIEGSRSLLHPFGETYGLDTPIAVPLIADVYSVEVALMALRADGNWQPRQRDRVTMRYAIEASSHVLNVFEKLFPNDERPRTAIDAAIQCFEFYSSPDVWLAEHNWGAILYTIKAAQAALDSADALAISDPKAEAEKCAAWAAGQAAGAVYHFVWPVFCEKGLKRGRSASERAEFVTWAYDAANEATKYSSLAAVIYEGSAKTFEWQRSLFLGILAAEDQDV